jgi:hypothetical protein
VPLRGVVTLMPGSYSRPVTKSKSTNKRMTQLVTLTLSCSSLIVLLTLILIIIFLVILLVFEGGGRGWLAGFVTRKR